jgi:tRNA threonylcarbamoyladenosine biosynthesis protein TsaB
MKLLALDTSTDICSVALMIGSNMRERDISGMRHAESILPSIQALLAEGGITLGKLDAIAFGRGPGSFTSLRIGAAVVQGLAFGADIPVLPVSSLAALAQSTDAERVLTALDARMGQVYTAPFLRGEDGLMRSIGAETVCAPDDVPLPDGTDWTGAGSGWDKYSDLLCQRIGARLKEWLPALFPRARGVAALAMPGLAAGEALAPEQALPVYLRDDVARKAGR